MRKNRLLAFFVVGIVLCFSACKNNDSQPAGNDDDTLYSGARFNEHIRSTAARTPEEERLGFKLPEGFEINLYASEPDIGKPINFCFDAKGRMWVTQSFEYPFRATGTGKDRLTILEDTDNDGRADKFIHFNDTLNIPLGIMPVSDGAVVFSTPNIYKFTDTNGDGKPESSKKLIGPFEVRDTHGMVNNFATGYDGWIYACHGYTNISTVAGSDGDSVHLVSGNTIRFRPDGSHVEHETAGRINPFGLMWDELGYLYSTDCHISPMHQLIRGADYPQWGKEEIMGFAPDMQPFSNEATALAGLAYYSDNKFPEEYRKNFFIGDVVKCKVYRNSFSFKGSSPVGKKEDDFVLSSDPWFRPVDVKMGPDGAIYIADFYNSIIGHYEVPLDHPKRDRISGRIWRITYKGRSTKKTDWTKASLEELFKAFNGENLPVKLTAADQLADRIGAAAIAPAKELLNKKEATVSEYVHSLWVLQRLNALTDHMIKSAAAHKDPVIRVHALRVAREQKDSSSALYPVIVNALKDNDPHVRRAAVELMDRYVHLNSVETLVDFRKKIPGEDTHMIYTVRLMLRNLLRHESLMKDVAAAGWKNEDAAVLATVLEGVQTPVSASFLYNYVKNADGLSKNELPRAFMHVARFIPENDINAVVITAKEKGKHDDEMEFLIFQKLQQGIIRRGSVETAGFKDWGKKIAVNYLEKNIRTNKTSPQEELDKQRFAIELAGTYRLAAVQDELVAVLKDTSVKENIRTEALKSLIRIDPEKNAVYAGDVINNNSSSADFKRSVVSELSDMAGASVYRVLASIKNAPPDLQHVIILAMAGSREGKKIIFDKVKKGELFARILAEPKIEERFMVNITPAELSQYKKLTSDLPELSKEKTTLIRARIADYFNETPAPSVEQGHVVFVKNCSPCHSMKGEGGKIGPQLDGVGKWGVHSLSEKILDPNRNISENFRNYTIKLKDGKIISGLFRREEGEVEIFADATGKEFAVPKKEIRERKASKYTLMPDQFANTINQDDFNALIAYLIAQK